MDLPTHDSVKFPDNEVLLLKFDDVTSWNNAVVISTGDSDKYNVQRSIRRGIVSNLTMSYFDVVHLTLEMNALGAKISKNLLFPGGLKQCIELGKKEFEKKAETDEAYASARARIHSEWDSLSITDGSGNVEVVTKAGITGVSHPTGKLYHDN